jgi:hypothetical protein
MPTSTLIRATFFALGAAVGGGAVAVLNASKKGGTPSTSLTSQAIDTTSKAPLIELGVTGDARFSAGAPTTVGTVLKYGNPGTHPRTAFVFPLSLGASLGILYLPSGGFFFLNSHVLCHRSHFRPTHAQGVCSCIRSSTATSYLGQFGFGPFLILVLVPTTID